MPTAAATRRTTATTTSGTSGLDGALDGVGVGRTETSTAAEVPFSPFASVTLLDTSKCPVVDTEQTTLGPEAGHPAGRPFQLTT